MFTDLGYHALLDVCYPQERWQLRAAKEQQEATLRRMEDVLQEKRNSFHPQSSIRPSDDHGLALVPYEKKDICVEAFASYLEPPSSILSSTSQEHECHYRFHYRDAHCPFFPHLEK